MAAALTSFEEQVLQAYGALLTDSPVLKFGIYAHDLRISGHKLFGPHWGGRRFDPNFSGIDAALGRLQKKGLVYRSDGTSSQVSPTRGTWFLTAEGRDLLGLENTPP